MVSYSTMNKAELEAMAMLEGKYPRKGTGKGGKVTVADLKKALGAYKNRPLPKTPKKKSVKSRKMQPPPLPPRDVEMCPEDRWKKCISGERGAQSCISDLKKLYPDLFVCPQRTDGPAKAVVQQDGKIVGMVNGSGQVKPIAPPLPPPLPSANLPVVKSTPGSRSALLQQIQEGKELKKVSPQVAEEMKDDRSALLEQIRKGKALKTVKKCDRDYVYDAKLGKCIPVSKGVKAGDIGGMIAEAMAQRRGAIKGEDDYSTSDW